MSDLLAIVLLMAPVQGEPAEEFANRYRARHQSIQTCMIRSKWEDFSKGRPTRRDDQTFYIDVLGRRRAQMQSEQYQEDGTWIPHEQVPYKWDILFDGEVTASMTFDPRKDRVGDDLTTDEQGGYRAAQIFDGEWGSEQQRTPITFIDGVLKRLESAIQNKQTIDVESETEERVRLRFPNVVDVEYWQIDVDKTRDWVPVAVALVDKSGKVRVNTELKYAETATGILYPEQAALRSYGERSIKETPLRVCPDIN